MRLLTLILLVLLFCECEWFCACGGGVRARVVSHRWCLRVEFVRGRGACGAADGAVGRSRVGARHGRPGAGDGGRGMTDSSERAFVKV